MTSPIRLDKQNHQKIFMYIFNYIKQSAPLYRQYSEKCYLNKLKEKFEIEFPIQASPHMLYQYISSASGLCEWFADDVNSRGKSFSFLWDGSEEVADLISSKSDTLSISDATLKYSKLFDRFSSSILSGSIN